MNDIKAAGTETGTDSISRVEEAINQSTITTTGEGMSDNVAKRQKKLLAALKCMLHIDLGTDSPADSESYSTTWKPNMKPYKTALRSYAPAQISFLAPTIKWLEQIGALPLDHTSVGKSSPSSTKTWA